MKEKNTKQGGLAYFIIGLILVLVFIIGALMWGETERAEAAQTSDGVYYPSMKEIDCGEYVEKVNALYEYFPYFLVLKSTRNDDMWRMCFLSETSAREVSINSATSKYDELPLNAMIAVSDGVVTAVYDAGNMYAYIGRTYVEGYEWELIGTNFTLLVKDNSNKTEEAVAYVASLPQNNLVHPKDYIETLYSTEAPYISFNRLSVKNLIADGETRKSGIFSDMYEDYTKESTWTYHGKLNNRDMADIEYLLEVDFAVEIPLISYVEELAYMMDVNLEQEHSVLSNLPDMVTYWNTDNGAEKYTYEFTYTFPIAPDIDGNFSYQLSFDTIEGLVMYFNEDARERIREYSDYWRSILLSFLHVDCTTAVVKTTREDCIVYGKICTNQFDRGVHDICIEVIPEIDINTATPEEIDKILTDALEDAHDKYLTELEKQLEELENQLNASTSLVEGENLWNAFKTTVSGVLGMLSTVLVIPQALGSIFTFFPQEMQDFMGYVLIVCFVVIVWKAFKK